MTSFDDCSFSIPVMVSAKANSYLQDKAKIELSLSCNSDGTFSLESKGKQRNKISKVVASKIGYSKFEGSEASGTLQIVARLKIIFSDSKVVDSGYDLLSIKFNFSGFAPDINNMKYLLSVVKMLPTDKSNLPADQSLPSSGTTTSATTGAKTSQTSTRLPLTLNQSIYEFLMERNVQCETLPSCTIMAADDEKVGGDKSCDINAMYAELANCKPVRLDGGSSSHSEGYLCPDPDPDLSNLDFRALFPKAQIVECEQGNGRSSEKPWLRLLSLAENTSFKGAPALVSASGPIYTDLEQEFGYQGGRAVEDVSVSASVPNLNVMNTMRVNRPEQRSYFKQDNSKQEAKEDNKNKQQEPDKAMVSYFGDGRNLKSVFKRD